jgi:hypothetical protein
MRTLLGWTKLMNKINVFTSRLGFGCPETKKSKK